MKRKLPGARHIISGPHAIPDGCKSSSADQQIFAFASTMQLSSFLGVELPSLHFRILSERGGRVS